ncbi:DUF5958 family protein [Streptomyces sp. PKU-EA00015]|uniref:DUF5958 family protein n=1 Tax=Streptomyces sp. PKU-EA00015 TaxID=2748326 RepID=UPI00210900EB|nr:DUF5958 family protein [Streptomyces sp. PKU-EA00015]
MLVALFGIADTRRRALNCTGGCGHEWHNLSTRHQACGPDVRSGWTRPGPRPR